DRVVRRLPLSQHLGPAARTERAPARDVLDPRRPVPARRGLAIRRCSPRRARQRHRRHLRLPPGPTRLPRAPGAHPPTPPALPADPPRHPPGNEALFAPLESLTWLRATLAAFAGDPDRITLFGVSAGSASTCALMASPLAAGMFSRAILESDACPGADDT